MSAYLSCDWGTSSFRIRWVEGERVLREFRDDTGCKVLYERALAAPEKSRSTLYEKFLRQVLGRWQPSNQQIPLVISGMASSTIGWKELPYARTPLSLDGRTLQYETLEWDSPRWVGQTYLISGLATEDDMMRGEETEAIGLLSAISAPEDQVLVLPGTHSKHLVIEKRRIVGIRTYMTGELFDLLSRQSILKATMEIGSLKDPSPANLTAFDSGVRQAQQSGLGASLFKTRSRAVLQGGTSSQNTWFLSGLLIGAEIAELPSKSSVCCVVIGGGQELREKYQRAFSTLRMTMELRAVEEKILEMAVPYAHRLFLSLRRNER